MDRKNGVSVRYFMIQLKICVTEKPLFIDIEPFRSISHGCDVINICFQTYIYMHLICPG